MNLNDYVKLALRTESVRPFDNTDHGRRASRLVHAALGIESEMAELGMSVDDANTLEELGDLCWYLAVLADEFGFDLEEVRHKAPAGSWGAISDQAKRVWFYNAPADVTAIEKAAGNLMQFVFVTATISLRVSLDLVLEANVRKLRTRFPDKFSDQAALNRDLEAESKALQA